MAKYVVAATKHKRQVRIALPALLVKDMHWEKTKTFIIERSISGEVKIRELFREEDLK